MQQLNCALIILPLMIYSLSLSMEICLRIDEKNRMPFSMTEQQDVINIFGDGRFVKQLKIQSYIHSDRPKSSSSNITDNCDWQITMHYRLAVFAYRVPIIIIYFAQKTGKHNYHTTPPHITQFSTGIRIDKFSQSYSTSRIDDYIYLY